MRKLLVTLFVLTLLLVVTDRVGVAVAQSQVAQRMQDTGELDGPPEVRVRGFPFLTQAVGGRYDRIDVSAKDLRRNGVTLAELDVRLAGARIPLADGLAGKVTVVPVEGLSATAVVTYVELASRSKILGLKAVAEGNTVVLTGRVTVLGRTISAKATSTVQVSGNRLLVRARSVTALGAKTPLPQGLLDFSVSLARLPYGLKLDAARVGPAGVLLTASSGPTVLTP